MYKGVIRDKLRLWLCQNNIYQDKEQNWHCIGDDKKLFSNGLGIIAADLAEGHFDGDGVLDEEDTGRLIHQKKMHIPPVGQETQPIILVLDAGISN